MQIVNGATGTKHVTGSMDGALYAGVYGAGSYVLPIGNKRKASMVDANTVRILDGDVLINGRHGHVPYGTSEDLTVQSGTTGYRRNDLVVARYEYDASTGLESMSLKVLRGAPTTGTPSDPSIETGDVLKGAAKADMKLWRIPINGVSVGTPVQLFTVGPTVQAASSELADTGWQNVWVSSDVQAYVRKRNGWVFFTADNAGGAQYGSNVWKPIFSLPSWAAPDKPVTLAASRYGSDVGNLMVEARADAKVYVYNSINDGWFKCSGTWPAKAGS